ncbi:MAG: malate synthase A, partial [Bauldia sp.]|nr:malate synthase A [Bauldia sp.]
MSAVEHRTNVQGVEIRGGWGHRYGEILNESTLAFLAGLHRKFNPSRLRLLARRDERQQRFDAGDLPDFLPETKHVRDGDWKVAP